MLLSLILILAICRALLLALSTIVPSSALWTYGQTMNYGAMEHDNFSILVWVWERFWQRDQRGEFS